LVHQGIRASETTISWALKVLGVGVHVEEHGNGVTEEVTLLDHWEVIHQTTLDAASLTLNTSSLIPETEDALTGQLDGLLIEGISGHAEARGVDAITPLLRDNIAKAICALSEESEKSLSSVSWSVDTREGRGVNGSTLLLARDGKVLLELLQVTSEHGLSGLVVATVIGDKRTRLVGVGEGEVSTLTSCGESGGESNDSVETSYDILKVLAECLSIETIGSLSGPLFLRGSLLAG
jgi:hypothetical protein